MAAVAAGGEVRANPRGREMGLARKMMLTPEGRSHPMYEGKPTVFEGYITHEDEVTHLPPGALLLATNQFTHVQALSVTHKRGTFWATQYHPEYDLHEMARLTWCRGDRLIGMGFFDGRKSVEELVDRMEALHETPDRMDLRWLLAIDDDVLDDSLRECEFRNWLHRLVIPGADRKRLV